MQYRAVLAAMACVLVACDQRTPTEPTPVLEPSFDATSALEAFVLSDDPLAAQVLTTPLSESGADIFGVGGGQSNLGTHNFDLSAHTGPQGDFGHWGVKVYDLTGELIVRYTVDVNCVHIHGPGNRGVIKGVVQKVEPPINALGVTEGQAQILGIDDEGGPSDPPADDFAPHSDVFPGNCKNIVYIANVNNVNQGQIRIKLM